MPRPIFLLQDYKDNGDNVVLEEVSKSVFYRFEKEEESIIMAGNADEDAPKECRMVTVIAKKQK